MRTNHRMSKRFRSKGTVAIFLFVAMTTKFSAYTINKQIYILGIMYEKNVYPHVNFQRSTARSCKVMLNKTQV